MRELRRALGADKETATFLNHFALASTRRAGPSAVAALVEDRGTKPDANAHLFAFVRTTRQFARAA
jgi:hypothetical protein